MKGYLYLFSEQGIHPTASIYDESIGGYAGTFAIEKKTYYVEIYKQDSLVYKGKWTYSRKNTIINGIYSPKEIEPNVWKNMFKERHDVYFKDFEIDLSKSIIKSMLDTDLYKLKMGQFAYFNSINKKQMASHKLHIRCNTDLRFLKEHLEEQINYLRFLRFKDDELKYLKNNKYLKGMFKDEYLNFLKNWSFRTVLFKVEEKDNLELSIFGSWEDTILAEVMLSSIINELYFINKGDKKNSFKFMKKELEKIKNTDIKIAEMGTRRRHSFCWQEKILKLMKKEIPQNLVGTSNVFLAKKMNLKPIGTIAHEFFQAYQVLGSSFETSQKEALYSWSNFYKKESNVALTDTLSTDTFISDCDKGLLKRYKGFRQDSGCPFIWGNKLLTHFHQNGINAKEKDFIFSDSLDFDKSLAIYSEFKNKVGNVYFGIGTFLSNNFVDESSLKIVIKLDKINDIETIKVSDDKGKISSMNEELKKKALNLIEEKKTYPSLDVSVDAIIKNKEGKVLVIKRADKNEVGFNQWSLVGGFVDYFEKVDSAVLREVFEEVGIKLENPKFFKYYDDVDRDSRKRNISFVFTLNFCEENMCLNKKEVSDFKWIGEQDINLINFADHKQILSDYFKFFKSDSN